MNPVVSSIVEGHGEVEALPVLLRNIAHHFGVYDVTFSKPWRENKTKIIQSGEIERLITLVQRNRLNTQGIIVVLDADDDCPVKMGRTLRERAESVTDVPVRVVLASKEFEAWFLAVKDHLRGVCGIREDAQVPDDFESIRGAKERLISNMTGNNNSYVPTQHQAAFAHCIDIDVCRQRSRSFDKLVKDVEDLLRTIGVPTNEIG